jgi:precorrin-6x reductase
VSVLVTGGSVRAELLLQQLDLVTGIAALLAAGMRERAPSARALGTVAGQALGLESLREATVSKPAVHATRPGISAEQLLALC